MARKLFDKHDENQNGSIEFGGEFDALLYATYELFGERGASQKLSRD